MRLDRLEADLLEKQQAMEDMRTASKLAESREVRPCTGAIRPGCLDE